MKSLNELQRLRGFKVETLSETDTKPVRIKITDLRYSKSVTLGYGARHQNLSDVLIEFFTSKGIELCSQAWAENADSIHLYGMYFTTNFDKHIK